MLKKYNDIIKAISKDPSAIYKLPASQITVALMKAAMKKDPMVIYSFPKEKITDAVVLGTLSIKSSLISYFSASQRTYDACFEAAGKYNRALKFIPERFLDDEMIEEVLTNFGFAIEYLPRPLWNEVRVRMALKSDPFAISIVGEQWLDENVCFDLIRIQPLILSAVPKSMLSQRIIEQAITQIPGLVLQLDTMTEPLLKLAISRGSDKVVEILEGAPDCLKTDEIMWQALIQNPAVIRQVEITRLKRMIEQFNDVIPCKHLPSSIDDALKRLSSKQDDAMREFVGKWLGSFYSPDEVVQGRRISEAVLTGIAPYFESADLMKALGNKSNAKRQVLAYSLDI